jgi:formylmethanofuran dehydrogenase subunit E
MRQHESTVVVDDALSEGLYRIERNDYLMVVFHIHESDGYTLRGPRRYGEARGTFACRSPHRPNPIGVTTVELVERTGCELRVEGLDAIDGTPVLDLKPHAPSLDCPDREPSEGRRTDPRAGVRRAVRSRDVESLVLDAGAVHGAYCPALALGVMAGVYAQRELGVATGDAEDVVAVVETTGCFADGVRYVTGCTTGNGGLVYRDDGKTAATLARRSAPESGVRICLRAVGGVPSGCGDADAAFDVVGRPLREFCDVETGVGVALPAREPAPDDAVCDACGEPVRRAKAVECDGELRCRPCAGESSGRLARGGVDAVERTRPADGG